MPGGECPCPEACPSALHPEPVGQGPTELGREDLLAQVAEQSQTPQREWVSPKRSKHQVARNSGGRADPVFWWQRELAAMEKEMAHVQTEACRLGQLYPVSQEGLAKQLAEVQEAWATLNVKVQERAQQLEQAAQGHAFLGRCQNLL